MTEFENSYCESVPKKEAILPVADKLYYQQMFHITELPKDIYNELL
jgi:hypothetical protein